MAWTSPRTWLAGERISAALLNAQVRDNFKAVGDAWTAYTPTWAAATTNPVIGNGTISGRYMQAGKLVNFAVRIQMGSTTTYGTGAYTISLPVTASNIDYPGVSGYWYDSSPITLYGMVAIGTTTSEFRMFATNAAASYATGINPFTLAVNDKIMIGGTYEAA